MKAESTDVFSCFWLHTMVPPPTHCYVSPRTPKVFNVVTSGILADFAKFDRDKFASSHGDFQDDLVNQGNAFKAFRSGIWPGNRSRSDHFVPHLKSAWQIYVSQLLQPTLVAAWSLDANDVGVYWLRSESVFVGRDWWESAPFLMRLRWHLMSLVADYSKCTTIVKTASKRTSPYG